VAKPKILIIEDEPDLLEVMQYNLEREGHRVVVCRNGEQGLSRIRTDNPDLVILDLMLPGMDGVEVCRQVKADPVTRAVPIIMVTAKGEESDIVLGLGIGADDYITKPFSPRELVARVKVVLRRGGLREESGAGERVVRGTLTIDLGRHEARVDGVLPGLASGPRVPARASAEPRDRRGRSGHRPQHRRARAGAAAEARRTCRRHRDRARRRLPFRRPAEVGPFRVLRAGCRR
jgi:CheY-like chemotaxis protein